MVNMYNLDWFKPFGIILKIFIKKDPLDNPTVKEPAEVRFSVWKPQVLCWFPMSESWVRRPAFEKIVIYTCI
jgi:hypothetical protein